MASVPFPRRSPSRRVPSPAALLHDRSGTAVLEFAIAGPAFIALLTGIFWVALGYLNMEGLETAAQGAGRLFQTGLAQSGTIGSNKGMSASDFRNAICNGATVTSATGATVTVAAMLPPFMACNNLTTNVVIQPSGTSFNPALLATPAYNCYGTACNSASSSTTATTATSSAIAGSQNRIVVVQLFYKFDTFAQIFGVSGLSMTSRSGQASLTSAAVVTAEQYSCATGQTSC